MANKILVVEDEKDIRDVLEEAFNMSGYETVCVDNAEDALQALTPDIQVMFLDLKLPGQMDGVELCRKIRKDYPLASIFAMTGHCTLYELADCREAGFDDYFTKPAKLEMLIMAARLAFERFERWQDK